MCRNASRSDDEITAQMNLENSRIVSDIADNETRTMRETLYSIQIGCFRFMTAETLRESPTNSVGESEFQLL